MSDVDSSLALQGQGKTAQSGQKTRAEVGAAGKSPQ